MIKNVGKESDVALALLTLFEAAADQREEFKDAAKVDTSPVSDDECETKNVPLFSSFVLVQADAVFSCRKPTNFNLDEFQNLHYFLHNSNTLRMFSEKRRKCIDSRKNHFFVLLIVSNHC